MNGRRLAEAVARASRASISGQFSRHSSANQRELSGSDSGGRWGPQGAYPVLYLGRPRDSVVVEAYRHHVDPFAADGMTGAMVAPRRYVICDVTVTDILDLHEEAAMLAVGLTADDLQTGVGEYEACHAVGRVAHQLEIHGIIAPAATGLGETLALFERHLPADELPRAVSAEMWDGLPADPRRLRLVEDDTA